MPISLPPLRQREGDIPKLAQAFLERLCVRNDLAVKGFTPEAIAFMESYRWPGNVRELRNIIERIAILCDATRIEPRHLPSEVRQSPPLPTGPSRLPPTWDAFKKLKQQIREAAVGDLECRFLVEALQRCGGNVSRAAEDVGMQRTHFHALMRKYGLSAETDS